MIYWIICIMICYLIIFLWLGNGIIRHHPNENKKNFPEVTVIVSAHNEESNINQLTIVLNVTMIAVSLG